MWQRKVAVAHLKILRNYKQETKEMVQVVPLEVGLDSHNLQDSPSSSNNSQWANPSSNSSSSRKA